MFFVNGESALLVAFGKYTLSKLYSHCTQLLYLYFHRNMVSDISVLSGDDSINACDCRCCISSFNSQTSRMSIFTSCAHNCWIFISVDWWNDNKLVKSGLYCSAKNNVCLRFGKHRFTDFSPTFHSSTRWKCQKTFGFLTLPGDIETEHRAKIGLCVERCAAYVQYSRSKDSVSLYFSILETCKFPNPIKASSKVLVYVSVLFFKYCKIRSQRKVDWCICGVFAEDIRLSDIVYFVRAWFIRTNAKSRVNEKR